jgi:predicted ATPase
VREVIGQRQAMCNLAEQQVVTVASVAGHTFSAAAVATGIDEDVVRAEAWCAGLAQRALFLQDQGVETWPDGTVATRYGFLHALYQQVLYEQIPAARRAQLHHRVGAQEEAGYGRRASEIATRLALHFELGHDYPRAITYHRHAATNALRRCAYTEAIAHCRQGLALLATLPETPDRAQRELDIQTILAPVLMATRSPVAPEVEQAYARARVLCRQVGQTPKLVWALEGLWAFDLVRGRFHPARELGHQLLNLTQQLQSAPLSVVAHQALGLTLFYLGEFTAALHHLEHGLTAYNAQRQSMQGTVGIHDPGVMCGAFAALALCVLGYPDQALQRSQEMLRLAQDISHPYSLAFAQCAAAVTHQCRREAPEVQHLAAAAIKLASEQGFPMWSAMGTVLHGWACAMQRQQAEGIEQVRRGLYVWRATGATNVLPYYLILLADAYREAGQVDAGRKGLEEALAIIRTTGECWWEAELYRLRGELLLLDSPADTLAAEQDFQQALAVSRRQAALFWELRAARSLGRLWLRHGKREAARQLLAEVHKKVSEGFNTLDCRQTRTLLDELG